MTNENSVNRPIFTSEMANDYKIDSERVRSLLDHPLFRVYESISRVTQEVSSMAKEGRVEQSLYETISRSFGMSTIGALETELETKGYTTDEIDIAHLIASRKLVLPNESKV